MAGACPIGRQRRHHARAPIPCAKTVAAPLLLQLRAPPRRPLLLPLPLPLQPPRPRLRPLRAISVICDMVGR